MASFLGIDPVGEFELMALAYDAVAAPLPSQWIHLPEEQQSDRSGNSETQYLQLESGRLRTTHPADVQLFAQLAIARRAPTPRRSGRELWRRMRELLLPSSRQQPGARYWMRFREPHSGRPYYYNFLSGRRQAHSPRTMNAAATTMQAHVRGWLCRRRIGAFAVRLAQRAALGGGRGGRKLGWQNAPAQCTRVGIGGGRRAAATGL
eukprot:SAG11_NODE_8235_length_1043_cov_0.885593_2_plen_206_part_00